MVSGNKIAMTDILYKAYLSYSHTDQVWADWLHDALESYRVPARLVNKAEGEDKPSLAPIFKDREDLSSAADLSESLQLALRQSGALLVVCSPAAAASRWVNEEIRTFRTLHGSERIFCVIVDGDPQAKDGEEGCFPPALFEGVAEGDREPLAADARKYADGKRQAMLKIAAGLLGVRLDELRRRDLKRRRRQQAVAATVVVAALALGGLTINAKLAEQQERAQAEQMAAFIVDLGDDLRGDIDLESMARISEAAMGYLDQLDPKNLSLESQVKVGKALRQVGSVNWSQGALEEALEAFERSRQAFIELNINHPTNDEIWFELAQAEFWSGYLQLDLEDNDQLRVHWDRYLEIAREQHEAQPDDPRWLLELSYATSNLINIGLALRENVDQQVLDQISDNIELAGRALHANEGNPDAMSHYASELAFAADAQVSVCSLQDALRNRHASLAVTEQLAAASGSSFDLLEVAYRQSGLANVYLQLGDIGKGLYYLLQANEDFERRLARDPSNELLALDFASASRRLGGAYSSYGDLDKAKQHLEAARSVLAPAVAGNQSLPDYFDEYRYLILNEVIVARLGNEVQYALTWLDRHRALFAGEGDAPGRQHAIDEARLIYRYEMFYLTGIDPSTNDKTLLAGLPSDRDGFKSCLDAELLARHGMMTGDFSLLERQVSYLAAADYNAPYYQEFCSQHDVCSP